MAEGPSHARSGGDAARQSAETKRCRRTAVTAWIASSLKSSKPTGGARTRAVSPRRLNRVEYSNTIRDLLGMRFDANADFPADDVGYGFDNIGDVLTLPPVLFEKYLAAAEKISARAMREVARPHPHREAERRAA